MVGDCGDRTLEGPSGSGRGSYSRRSLRPAGGRQRLNLKPEGEALLKLPQRARMVLQSPDTRPWGFGSQVHTPFGSITGMGSAGIRITELASGVTISAVRVLGNAGRGVDASRSSLTDAASVVENCLIQRNLRDGIQGNGLQLRKNLISLNGEEGASCRQCSIIDNQSMENGKNGIACRNCLVRGNYVARNVAGGIFSHNGTILNNVVSQNANPQVEMGEFGGVAWGGNNLSAPGSPVQLLFALPDPPGRAQELAPNSCNGFPCLQPTPL